MNAWWVAIFSPIIGNLRGKGGDALAEELAERTNLDLSRRIGDLLQRQPSKTGIGAGADA